MDSGRVQATQEEFMKAQSQRQLRAGELVRRAVSDIIREGRVHDPHVNTAAVTITEARTSPDLRHATVYVDLLGGGDRNAVAEALNHASGFIQRELGKQIELKFTPKLRFAVDDRIEDVAQVDAVLDRPTVKRDLDDEGED
ncbi:MAG: 30S ribosome-binding factor RbfA [Oceanicaulis sp.]|uniref:30S ribosome-binding factor RbfA n=2 Tax=Maricaulaceae TaxID=2800061 RepID=UPI000483F409|nr:MULTISPECIES: 30S ribosome-binding factor RbfA [Oceanicaulis]MAP49500.1 30S ribosome-binding factor RbfA [Oceanicaulis sp.]MBL4538717.1 30S ribosome-binding factor RbfA [Oceanicaulis sp.]HCR67052.1 30S ribosome-binding factor RbfA [Oceanicaulis sp.]